MIKSISAINHVRKQGTRLWQRIKQAFNFMFTFRDDYNSWISAKIQAKQIGQSI